MRHRTLPWTNTLKQTLEEQGITPDELARMVGLHRVTVYNVMAGRTLINPNMLYKIACALDVTVEHCWFRGNAGEAARGDVPARRQLEAMGACDG